MEDKYILITGASSGIGRAVAIKLSNEYPLILCGRNMENLEKTKSQCNSNCKIIFWPFDLQKVDDIGISLASFIRNQAVSIGGFVHSAGISPIYSLRMLSLDTMYKIMNVNFLSAVEILRVLGSKRINNKCLDSVVFISSIAAVRGVKGQAVYSASKGALNAFARSMAAELAPNVRVNCVMPGGLRTAMTETMYEVSLDPDELDNNLLGAGSVNDIAEAVYYFVSDKSRWITGQSLAVDGGFSIV